MRPLPLLVAALLGATGCAGPVARSLAAYHDQLAENSATAARQARTLFAEDRLDLPDERLDEILATTVPVGADSAIAVYNCSWSPYFPGRMGEQLTALGAAIPNHRLAKIPALLLPDAPGLPDLRRAAARLQCEFILIYTLRFKPVDHTAWYLFLADEKQVTLGTVEALLYDIRTGIVPCTATVDMTAAFRESEAEDDPDGWRDEAMNRAITGAMAELSRELVDFIARSGTPTERRQPDDA